jgi:hypothetical protein
VIPGILQTKCESILKDFFLKLRKDQLDQMIN